MKFIKPSQGTYRVVKRFALFPITIYNETRWLETVYIEQRYDCFSGQIFSNWVNDEFTTKEKAELWRAHERKGKKNNG